MVPTNRTQARHTSFLLFLILELVLWPLGSLAFATTDLDQRLISQNEATGISASNELDEIDIEQALKEDNDPQIRDKGILRLESLGSDAKKYVPLLVQLLHDPDAYIRAKALVILKRLKPVSRDAKYALKQYNREVKEKEKQERLQRQEEEKRNRNEALLIVRAVSEYRLRKAAYDQMNYELKYKTLSNDIQRKSEEINQYAKETLMPAYKNMAYYISEYGNKYGAGALRDLAIKNGFIDLLSHEQ